jgi:hypothetical protein
MCPSYVGHSVVGILVVDRHSFRPEDRYSTGETRPATGSRQPAAVGVAVESERFDCGSLSAITVSFSSDNGLADSHRD